MAKILEQLWNGELEPIDSFTKDHEGIRQTEDLMEQMRLQLEERMDEETQKLFARFCDCGGAYSGMVSEQAFCAGYRLGTRLTAEALLDTERNE